MLLLLFREALNGLTSLPKRQQITSSDSILFHDSNVTMFFASLDDKLREFQPLNIPYCWRLEGLSHVHPVPLLGEISIH